MLTPADCEDAALPGKRSHNREAPGHHKHINTERLTSTRRDYYWLTQALFLEVLTWFGGQKRLNLEGEDQGELQGKVG